MHVALVRTSQLSHERTSPRVMQSGVERSRVEWSEAEWNEAQRNGAEWSGTEQSGASDRVTFFSPNASFLDTLEP